jgi:hypothetical protein
MDGSDIASSCPVLRSRRPQTRLEASCTRTGRPRRRLLPTSSRTAGEGLGRKARMNVPEESDSGVLPMNHSNKVEQSMAESEEGRPLIKENIHQSSTRPTQSGTRVSQGLAGVRKASFLIACRQSSEIRAVCANERSYGSVRGAISNDRPYRDLIEEYRSSLMSRKRSTTQR